MGTDRRNLAVPQLQLPIFPEGMTELSAELAFQRKDDWVYYVHGMAPVFQHEAKDVAAFRLFTSQLVVQGVVREADIVRVFGVPRITVMRAVKLYRAEGPKGFFKKRGVRSAGVLKGETHQKAQALLDAGKSVPEVGKELGLRPNTLHKAIRQGRLHRVAGGAVAGQAAGGSKSERSEIDSAAAMGYATRRTEERVAAAMGLTSSAAVRFETAKDVPQGGVLLALPSLLANGLLRHSRELYELPNGFYGMASIFLLLAFTALARIKSIEQLRYVAPGEWGHLLGLDRIPEVRTLREKLEILCRTAGRAILWNTLLAKEWMMALGSESDLVFYVDGHVRVYSGDLTELPRHYVARERLCLRATTDYWINAMDGQPFFFVNKEVDPGLLATLRTDLAPFLEVHAPVSEQLRRRMEEDPRQHRFTLVFDREGYSPDFFAEMKAKRIAVLSYHKFPGEDWPREEFAEHAVRLAGGESVQMPLAERTVRLAGKVDAREVRKLTETGRQTSILSTDFKTDLTALAAAMFARWSQENFYKYMRQHYNLDRLSEYGTEDIPDHVQTVNPAWRRLDGEIRGKNGKRTRLLAEFGQLSLEGDLSEPEVNRYMYQQGEKKEAIDHLTEEIETLKLNRKNTPRHLPVRQLPETERFSRLLPERKHFVDTIKMISYRAETSMASLLQQKLARPDDARILLRQIYNTEVDLAPDPQAKTLTIRIHHLAQAAHDQALLHLCQALNATNTLFPDTDLRLVYQIGSSQIPRDQEF
jgi:transposase-like protein